MIEDQLLDSALRNIELFSPAEKARVLQLLEERERARRIETARTQFIPFVKTMWPTFIPGAHHNIMGDAFERVAKGELKRLVINMGPRHTKSELASWMLPAWFLGRFPRKKIIQASNTEALASGFGRRVRNMISGEYANEADDEDDEAAKYGQPSITYADVFPRVELAKDSQAAAGWHTSRGGEYFAIGINGKVTGKGGDIIIIDDPHSEQEAKQAETTPDIFDSVYDWYTSGPRQRLQPGGAIIIVMTRWSKRDLTGRVLKQMEQDIAAGLSKDDYDHWEVIELPAILDEDLPSERSMWPGFWPLAELRKVRNALPKAKWQAQYMQKPTSEAGAIIKREAWERWEHATPPPCKYIIQSWDTAQKKNERADYSAMTSWGIFEIEDPTTGKMINNIILLSGFKRRMEFPELKKCVKQFYNEDRPDTLLVEDKGSGTSLIQELRSMGIPVENFSYGRGKKKAPNDKVVRANAVTDIFASGYVWAPRTRFADAVIEECGEFPNGEHDDYVDTVVQALIRFRLGGLISTANDADEDEQDELRRRFKRKRMY